MRCRRFAGLGFRERVFPDAQEARSLFPEVAVGILYWLVMIAVLVGLWYAGLLRPTGLAGRTRAEEEKERQQDAVARWLKKGGDEKLR
jgi:hypothetical protein